jgi:hypothetical protein
VACVPATYAAVLPAGHIVVLLAGVLVRLLVLEQQPDGQRAIATAFIAAHPLCTYCRCALVSTLLSGFYARTTNMSPSLLQLRSRHDTFASPDIITCPALLV